VRDRRSALSVLTTGIVGDPAAEAVALTLVGAVAGDELPSIQPTPDPAWLAEFGARHRVRPLVARCWPDTGIDTVDVALHGVHIERSLVRAVDVLVLAGVRTLVLKGGATAHLDYDAPGEREVGDVDLLVEPAHLPHALEALQLAGCRPVVTHPFATASFFHSETLVDPDGIEIDLHHRLTQPARATTAPFTTAEPFAVGGRTLWAPSRHWRFLHALLHQMMNPPPSTRNLNGLLDLVVLWRLGIDVDKVLRLGAAVDMAVLTVRGMNRLADLLDDDRLRRPEPHATRAERRLAEALDGDHAISGRTQLAGNLATVPASRWPRYVRELVWPTKAYRELLGRSGWGQVRHVVHEVVGR
jgi:hypothetical protein